MTMEWIRNWLKPSGTPTSGEPSTLPVEKADGQLDRPVVFDPSLMHFGRAFRAGEPHFADPDTAARWHAQRTKVLWYILDRIAASPIAENLVLRGSTVMASWFRERARIPGDLDWVVIPQSWKMTSPPSLSLMDQLLVLIRGATIDEGLRIHADRFAVEDIWSYEKAPGRRLVFSWESDLLPTSGTIQMDIVFGEQIVDPPELAEVQLGPHPTVICQTATKAQSLAWKLLWLSADMHPMGKDLYDAVLLAESTSVKRDLIRETFQVANEPYRNPAERRGVGFEWEPFSQEYPHITGTADDWLQRLTEALNPH